MHVTVVSHTMLHMHSMRPQAPDCCPTLLRTHSLLVQQVKLKSTWTFFEQASGVKAVQPPDSILHLCHLDPAVPRWHFRDARPDYCWGSPCCFVLLSVPRVLVDLHLQGVVMWQQDMRHAAAVSLTPVVSDGLKQVQDSIVPPLLFWCLKL